MGIRIVFSIIKRKRFGWKFSPREIQPLKLVQIELNGYTKCSPESAQERVKEVTEKVSKSAEGQFGGKIWRGAILASLERVEAGYS